MFAEIRKAIEVMKSGGIILYPTDTIWGIGCDATNSTAIDKVYKIKKREDTKSLLILVDSFQMLSRYVEEVPPIAYELIEVSERPITIVYPKAKNLPANLTCANGSVAIRVTSDDFCRQLIQNLRRPIVSTSANFTGKEYPKNFRGIDPKIMKAVDYIVNWRKTETMESQPSSVIRIEVNGVFKIIRE